MTLHDKYLALGLMWLWDIRKDKPDNIGYSKGWTDLQVLANLLGIEL